MDKSQSSNGNNRYMKSMKGGKSNMSLMKNHGNTYPINTMAEKFDMGRMQTLGMERKGYAEQAFGYKY